NPENAAPVLDEYRTQFPADPMLPAWNVTLRLKQGRFEEATRVYREEAAKLADKKDRQALQYQFLTRMAAAGRPVQAYAEVEPQDADAAFRLLGGMLEDGCDREDQAAIEQLRRLVQAHVE